MNKMIEKFLSPVSLEIWKMLDHPENWIFDVDLNSKMKPYTIVHPETRISLWVSNGRWFLDGWSQPIFEYNDKGMVVKTLYKTRKVYIGLIDRHILWHKVRKVMAYLVKNDPHKILGELREYNKNRGK